MTSRHAAHVWLFWIMCLIWGSTWIPIKIGVQAMSPLLFAASRSCAAGAILLLVAWLRGMAVAAARSDLRTVVVAAVLANSVTYALLFWGIGLTDTGLSAVVNLSLTPVALLAIGALMREERITWTKSLAMLIGVAGLALLFSDKLRLDVPAIEIYGLSAVALAAISFAGGMVVARRLTARYSAIVTSGWLLLLGGLILGTAAIATGTARIDELSGLAHAPVLLSWLFLVLFSSVIAQTVFLRLSEAWVPSLAGLYAFVSPVIAVIAGIWLMNERLSPTAAVGMVLLLSTTVIALRLRNDHNASLQCRDRTKADVTRPC